MHPNDLVYKTLIKIIVTIISEYPEQTMWSLIAVIKSSIVNRALRGQEVAAKLKVQSCHRPTLHKASSRKPRDEIMRIAQHTTRLADSLLKLCNFEISGRPASMSLTRGLGFPVHAVLPCPIVVPLQSNLTAILPGPSAPKGKKHNPYPTDQPQLQSSLINEPYWHIGIEDEVEIMNSMQKPRKITIRGTDGLRYPFLVKPKDDLRKDARLMEFNSIINKLLKKDVESSRRQLCKFVGMRFLRIRHPHVFSCSSERRTWNRRMGSSHSSITWHHSQIPSTERNRVQRGCQFLTWSNFQVYWNSSYSWLQFRRSIPSRALRKGIITEVL